MRGVLVSLFVVALAVPTSTFAQTIQSLNYVRHNTVSFSNADADRISADATNTLRVVHSNGDVACNVVFRRNGNVRVTSVTDGIIDNASEFVSVEQVSGDVKVVRALNWCGSTGAGIIGCARVPGSSLAMVRFTSNQEGILMAHEFGHNQGLSHRNGTNNLMHPSIGTSRQGVNQAECNAFRSPATLVGSATAGSLHAQVSEVPDTLEAIRTHYYHGFPVSIGLALPKEDAGLIIEMLSSEAEVEWWPNALAALGLMGTEEGFEVIRAFMSKYSPSDLTDPQKFRAFVTAPIALGYHVNQTGDKDALEYLISGAHPNNLQTGTFSAITRSDSDASEQSGAIDSISLAGTFTAALSVAVTDDDAALKALQELNGRSSGEFAGAVSDAAEQAILEYQRAKSMGLEEYSEK